MNRWISGTALVRMLILAVGILFLFSCMEEDDMRAKTIAELGEPDEIEKGGFGPDEYEVYYYYNKNIDRIYIYNKSASGCGGSGNWYVAQTWAVSWDPYMINRLYEPPTIVHTPVKTAYPGSKITITAKITDDKYVKDAIMYYRIPGEESFLPITMTLEDSTTFAAEILPDRVTAAGVEYYLEASDDAHKSRLPERKGTYLVNISAGAAQTVGKTQSTQKVVPPKFSPISREKKSDIPL